MKLVRLVLCSVVVTVVMATAGPASARTSAHRLRHKCFDQVNLSRKRHGLHPVGMKWDLADKARHHSARMAHRYAIYHTTDLWGIVRRYGAHTWGENVGMSGSCGEIERAFMRSPEHRANILAGRFHRIGIGVVRSRHRVWVTYDFYG